MTALGKFPRGTGAPAVPLLIPAAACGGGGGGPRFSGIDANPILASDARLRLADGRQVRVPDVSRTPGGSRKLTVLGETVPFQVGDDGSDASETATVYGTRGDRNDFGAVAVHERDDGFTARYAAAGGVAHPDSPPLTGSATWRGDTVGLDGDRRVVRGGAEITVADLTDPLADVTLTPRARAAMRWNGPPIADGGFSGSRGPGNYVRGGFYGRKKPVACLDGMVSRERSGPNTALTKTHPVHDG